MNADEECVIQSDWLRPGSPEALKAGCSCAVLDNAYGAGRGGDGKRWGWWISGNCPLHAGPEAPR
jgi:hypothetical protein